VRQYISPSLMPTHPASSQSGAVQAEARAAAGMPAATLQRRLQEGGLHQLKNPVVEVLRPGGVLKLQFRPTGEPAPRLRLPYREKAGEKGTGQFVRKHPEGGHRRAAVVGGKLDQSLFCHCCHRRRQMLGGDPAARARIMACSMALRSSRTLPNQSRRCNSSRAAAEIAGTKKGDRSNLFGEPGGGTDAKRWSAAIGPVPFSPPDSPSLQ